MNTNVKLEVLNKVGEVEVKEINGEWLCKHEDAMINAATILSNLLAAASGRKMKAAEVRLIDGMDVKEIEVFAKMMGDVVAASMPADKHAPPFGYGHFND